MRGPKTLGLALDRDFRGRALLVRLGPPFFRGVGRADAVSLLWAAALWGTAARAGRRGLGLREDEAWLYGGLLFFAEAVSAAMGLGLCGRLSRVPLSLLCAALILGHVRLAASGRAPRERRAFEAWLLVPALMFAAVAGLRIFLALLAPPDSWDGLSYHLPIAMSFARYGHLDLAGWFGTERYYAWNGALLTSWLAVLDGGSLLFAKISQSLALPLMACAGASLGRRLAGPRWSGACALGFAAVPMAVVQAGVPYVDLLHAAFFASSAAAFTAYLRSGRRVHWLAAAVGFALALGVKSTLFFSALLLAAPALAFWLERGRRPGLIRLLPACAVLVVILGFAPYLRNWLARSNPIYPFAVSLAGQVVFPGPLSPTELLVSMEKWFVSAPVQWLWYPLHERVKGLAEYSYENGFGPLFAAGWVLWPLAFWRAIRRRDKAAACFLGLLPAAAFLFMAVQPVRAPRYLLFAVCVPIVAAAAVFRASRGMTLAAARGLWTAGLAFGLLGVVGHLGQSDGARASWRCLRVGWPLSQSDYYRRVFYSLGEAWGWLNARLQTGDVVAVNYGELLLPWSGFPQRARAVVVRGGGSIYPESYFAITADDWIGQLSELGARYAVVWSPSWYPHQGETERAWIAQRPERFRAAGSWQSVQLGRVDIYEVLGP